MRRSYVSDESYERAASARNKEGGDPMDLIHVLKNLDLDCYSLDDIVGLASLARVAEGEYLRGTLPVPTWLTDAIGKLERTIEAGRRDALEAELKRARGRLEGLKTAEEKREETRALIERLEAQLGGGE
jgi:hypothetical protein